MPQGKKKSDKKKKMLEKKSLKTYQEKSGNLIKFENTFDFVCLHYQIPYFPKPSNNENLVLLLSQTKIEKIFSMFTNLLSFQCPHLIKVSKTFFIIL